MSNKDFQRQVVDKVVEHTKIGTKGSKGQERTLGEVSRAVLEAKTVQQCLVLTPEVLSDLAWAYNIAISKSDSTEHRQLKGGAVSQYKKDLVRFIKTQAKPFPHKDAFSRWFKTLVRQAGLTWGVNIFYVPGTFDTVKLQLKKHNEAFAEKKEQKYDHSKFSNSINVDHGGEGTPSGLMGAAIGAERLKRTKKDPRVNKEFEKTFADNLKNILINKGLNTVAERATISKPLLKLVGKSHQFVNDDGTLVAGMSMLLTPKRKGDNLEQAGGETVVQNTFMEAFEKTVSPETYVGMKGSSTLLEKIEQVIFLNTSAKVKSNKRVKTEKRNKSKVAKKTKSEGSANTKKDKKYKIKKLPVRPLPKSVAKTSASSNQGTFFPIMAMINQKLPQVVKKNMKAPRLENQTGRFARSVKLQDVNTTPQGHPSFGYTYEKDPYKIFEVGTGVSPWASPDRDPRKLIDRSIREVAAQMAIGRFYTRRL